MKKLSKKRDEDIHLRKKYVDQSNQFVAWVDSLGLEQSFLGRWIYKLNRRFNLKVLSLLFLYSLLLAFISFFDFTLPYHVHVGEVVSKDIKSPISFEMTDDVATEAKVIEAEKSLPLVFDYQPDVYKPVVGKLYKTFSSLRELHRKQNWPKSEIGLEEAIKDFLPNKEKFERELGISVSDRLFEWLVENKFSARIENVMLRVLDKWSSQYLVDLSPATLNRQSSSAVAKDISLGGSRPEFRLDVGLIVNIKDGAKFNLEGIRRIEQFSKKDKRYLKRLAKGLLVPNLTLNKNEMALRAEKARSSVLPIQISIKKNQVIVASGTVVQPIHLTILREIKKLKTDRRADFMALMAAFLFVTLVMVFFSYLQRFTEHRVVVSYKDLSVMGVVTLTVLLMTKFFLFVTEAAFIDNYGGLVPALTFLFAAPVAAGPMIVGLLIASGEVVWIFSAFQATVLASMVDFNVLFFLTSFIGGIAGARGVYACSNRNQIYFAGIRAGLVNSLVIALGVVLTFKGDTDIWSQLIWLVPGGFLGGIGGCLVTMMLIPLVESSFNYTTDVKLLELSNLNNPIMQKLMMIAPGTYHHCMSVGTMVDAASKEIGANALLAKVMAYYHDIGKMEHAQYFVENQRGGYNPHDHISPYMSKTILVAHVKDGAEMALKYKLGKPILDGILQHHGTSLISYFYNKAVEEADTDHETVEESDFRYPGPKPQFKEAALVMLADAIEATARSLDEPTPARLQNIVKNIIQSKFIDGQLDECNLTLKDLSIIEKSFNRILLAIYHQRMEYPHMKEGKLVSVAKPKNKKGHQPA